ncbi:MAG: insulinase family protein [Candidatus Cloacimonetes bacterium]|nr:insulinase family protein [Candidatus Cloacimonadota bacterium]
MEQIKTYTLENNITILAEHIPHIQSVLLGLWVKQGSRIENTNQYGIAHFVEHMLFKGTKKRNAKQIAESLELIGGDLNAFTSREHCCYYAKAIAEETDLVFDVISDIVFSSNFDALEMDKERTVIAQEIDMYDDSPEELAHEHLVQTMYGSGLGHPVIGYKKNVDSFQRDEVLDFHKKFYQPSNIFLSVVGNFDNFDIKELSEKYFSNVPNLNLKSVPPKQELQHSGVKAVIKPIEQCHLTLGWHAYNITHKNRYVLHLISAYLGGGMSSLLFQDIRETHGLTYSIYSFVRAYKDVGFFGVYSAHSKESTSKILELIKINIEKIINGDLSTQKLVQLKSQLKGGLLLGLEKTSFRMNRIGVGHLYFDQVMDTDTLIQLVNEVTAEDIIKVAKEVFLQSPSIINVGNLEQEDLESAVQESKIL